MAAKTEWKIAPGSVAAKDNPFLIDAKIWNAVNVYVYNGVKLPEEMPQTDIKGAYALVRQHTKTWRDTTFPKSLSVADDIVDYGTKAPRLYQALEAAGDKLAAEKDGTPEYDVAKQRFMVILNRLVDEANQHAANAAVVRDLVLNFRGQTSDDHIEVKRLTDKYVKEFGASSDKEKALAKEIEDTRKAISDLNDEYNQAVVIAATSPTYFFAFPFGTIAAIVVAGIYGDKAEKIRKMIKDVNEALTGLVAEHARRVEMVAILKMASQSTAGIEKLMGPATEALDKIAGAWRAIAADMIKLRDFVANMRGGFNLYFIDIPEAVDGWKALAAKADAFRVNAFIRVEAAAAAA